jgi:hypothetical protein
MTLPEYCCWWWMTSSCVSLPFRQLFCHATTGPVYGGADADCLPTRNPLRHLHGEAASVG